MGKDRFSFLLFDLFHDSKLREFWDGYLLFNYCARRYSTNTIALEHIMPGWPQRYFDEQTKQPTALVFGTEAFL